MRDPYEPQLHRIRTKIHEAQRIGWRARSGQRHFGVAEHELRWASPLEEATVAEFEVRHGIEFPADYRAFLTRVSACRAGPFAGLLPLGHGLVFSAPDGFLAEASPLVPGVDYGPRWDEDLSIADEPLRGIFIIADQACGEMCGLVVCGKARGRVVYVGNGPPFFVKERTFLDWYEHWLADLIADRPTTSFGYPSLETP
ncbi:MAG: SMI1/KNR4 family protein [Myxococcota bacterium]